MTKTVVDVVVLTERSDEEWGGVGGGGGGGGGGRGWVLRGRKRGGFPIWVSLGTDPPPIWVSLGTDPSPPSGCLLV